MAQGSKIDPECHLRPKQGKGGSPTYHSIRSQLNWLYQIKDPATSRAFHNRLDHNRSNFFIGFIFVACLLFMGPTIVLSLYEEIMAKSHCIHIAATIIMIICVSTTFLCSGLLCLVESNIPFRFASYCSQRIRVIRQVLFITISLCGCVLFAKRNIFPMCGHGAAKEYNDSKWLHYNCEVGWNQAEIMLGQMFNLITVFMVLVVNIPSLRIEQVWIMCGINYIAIAIALIRVHSTSFTVGTCIFWAACTYTVIVDVHLRNVFQFFSIEYEHEQSEQFAWELKHTIANVAHDLKTPLSSFSNGVEVLKGVWSDMEHTLFEGGSARDGGRDGGSILGSRDPDPLVPQYCQQINACLQSIECTTVFMTMAINRCLDATKASNDMKLVPKHESLRLMEVIRLPILIMQSVQTKIPVSLVVEEATEICNFIITDKQWLQENVLCLLSNAVKYSSSGQVVLRVRKLLGNTTMEHEAASQLGEAMRCSTVSSVHSMVRKDITQKSLVTFTADTKLVFEVEDEGIGVDEKEQMRLFVPFQQSQRHAGGTGLGLYSLAKRVEALGGCYGVRRRNDQRRGSVFWFSIPYRPDAVMSEHENAVENLEVIRTVRFTLSPPTSHLDASSVTIATAPCSLLDSIGSGASTARSSGRGGGGGLDGSGPVARASVAGSEIRLLAPRTALPTRSSYSSERITERLEGESERRGRGHSRPPRRRRPHDLEDDQNDAATRPMPSCHGRERTGRCRLPTERVAHLAHLSRHHPHGSTDAGPRWHPSHPPHSRLAIRGLEPRGHHRHVREFGR